MEVRVMVKPNQEIKTWVAHPRPLIQEVKRLRYGQHFQDTMRHVSTKRLRHRQPI